MFLASDLTDAAQVVLNIGVSFPTIASLRFDFVDRNASFFLSTQGISRVRSRFFIESLGALLFVFRLRGSRPELNGLNGGFCPAWAGYRTSKAC